MVRLYEKDTPTQYIVVIEQLPEVEVDSIEKGMFVVLAMHYIFNMEYNPRLQDFYLFLEEKILHMPVLSCKRSATYGSVTNAIECYLHNSS